MAKASKEDGQSQEEGVRSRRSYTAEERSRCISEVMINNKSVTAVAQENDMPKSTLQGWIKKAKEGKEGYEVVSHSANEKEFIASPAAVVAKQVSTPKQAAINNEVKPLRDYFPEYRSRCIGEVIYNNKTVTDVAREVGMPYSTLYTWVKKAEEGKEGYEPSRPAAMETESAAVPNSVKEPKVAKQAELNKIKEGKQGYEASPAAVEKDAVVPTIVKVPTTAAPSVVAKHHAVPAPQSKADTERRPVVLTLQRKRLDMLVKSLIRRKL